MQACSSCKNWLQCTATETFFTSHLPSPIIRISLEGPAKYMSWFNEDPSVTQNLADVIACLKNPFARRIIPWAKIEERGVKEVSVFGIGETRHFHNYYVIISVD